MASTTRQQNALAGGRLVEEVRFVVSVKEYYGSVLAQETVMFFTLVCGLTTPEYKRLRAFERFI
jgi:hypothetical protein